MLQKINTQVLLSYSGLIPFIFIIIDKYFFYQLKEELIINFLIYYTLLIFVFIGSMYWNINISLPKNRIVFGFSPSFISTIIICLNLNNYNPNILILLLILCLALQLIFEYFLMYYNSSDRKIFFLLRIPLTSIVIILLGLAIY